MAAITPDQIQDLFAQYKGYMIAVLETLEEGGENGVPSTYLYLPFSAVGMSLRAFEGMLNVLKDFGFVSVVNDVVFRTNKPRPPHLQK